MELIKEMKGEGGEVPKMLREALRDACRNPWPCAVRRWSLAVLEADSRRLSWELPVDGHPARNVKVISKIGDWLKTSRIPKLLLWASPGALVTEEEASWMQENYRNLEAVYIGRGMHFVQEDQPESIGRNINIWHQRTFN